MTSTIGKWRAKVNNKQAIVSKSSKTEDIRMRYLSAFAIIFVVLGHITQTYSGIFTMAGWFPFYSFHIPVFLFVSGYFYNEDNERTIGRYCLRLIKKLIIPYYACQLFFLILQTLLRFAGFEIGHEFSFYNWLIWPWIRYQPQTFAIPSWYLIAFFISSVMYVLLRKIVSFIVKSDLIKEIVMIILTLGMGMAAVHINHNVEIGEAAGVYLRSVIMIFFLQVGLFYKKYLEKKDKLHNLPYFIIVFILRGIIVLINIFTDNPDVYGLYKLVNFGNSNILFFVSGILGIALWLRISVILGNLPQKIDLLIGIGKNTKEIMMFHLFGFFLFNLAFGFVCTLTTKISFDKEHFMTHIYHTSNALPILPLLYLAAGIAFSVLVSKLIHMLMEKTVKCFKRISD